MNPLLKRYRWSLGLFLTGLVLSGLTAFPLVTELRLLSEWLGFYDINQASSQPGNLFLIVYVYEALKETNAKFPFISYGTDWLAYGHLAIAVFFIRPFSKPLESDWVLRCGLICCAGVVPLALIAGQIRGIPLCWRLFDCSFGVIGSIPLWYCLHLSRRMQATQK